MEREKKEKIALFRFGVIAPLISIKKTEKGERERRIREITEVQWDIPYSGRSFICRTTVLEWLARYERSGRRLESLYPKDRSDRGHSRALDPETAGALITLKREFKNASLPALFKIAKERKILPAGFQVSFQTLYRLFQRHGLENPEPRENHQAFEAELVHDLWQSDAMHGPCVLEGGKLRKAYLFAFLDDYSRLIPHAEFYLRENLENYIDAFLKALAKRGLPRKLYVDNGPSFRSHHLAHGCAVLGIALIHARAYRPQGKGKIERWFLTLQTQWLPTLAKNLSLAALNEKLQDWIEGHYHQTPHSTTGQKPLERFLESLHLVRTAPANLADAFRFRIQRKVASDRTVSLGGRLFEAPVGLIGKTITLLWHPSQPDRIEVFWQERSLGFLVLLDPHVNYRLRSRKGSKPSTTTASLDSGQASQTPPPQSGKLFGDRQP
jgi:transposase InsO family protein